MKPSDRPWTVPVTVEDIPDTGQHYELVADAKTREAVARLAGLRALDRLEAVFDLGRRGEGVSVRGQLKARIGQSCVVTLEAIDSDLEEPIDLTFAPVGEGLEGDGAGKYGRAADEPPEPLEGGVVDLGAIATEFLILALDPYPRKPGAEFAVPGENGDSLRPFAALAALKKQP